MKLQANRIMNAKLQTYLPHFRQQMNKWVVFEDEEWTIMAANLNFKSLRKKDHFTRSGEVCREIGFILSGSVRLYHVKDAEETTSYFCMENEFISSYKSFIRQEPGLSSIQVLEDTMLITLSYDGLQELLNNQITSHKMDRFGRLLAEHLIICYEDRVQAFVTQSPEERYAALFNTNRRMLQNIPQHYLANYLGITPVSLSRIRRRISGKAKV